MNKSKVTEDLYTRVKMRYEAGGITQARLAKEFGISEMTVARIVNTETYGGYKRKALAISRAGYKRLKAKKEHLKPLLAQDDAPTVMVAQIKYAQITALKLLMDTMGIECQFMVK